MGHSHSGLYAHCAQFLGGFLECVAVAGGATQQVKVHGQINWHGTQSRRKLLNNLNWRSSDQRLRNKGEASQKIAVPSMRGSTPLNGWPIGCGTFW